MTVAQNERAALVETLRAVAPDAPTLCGDWTARDLAAHLVLRERRLDAAAGILIPQLAGYTERVQNKVAASTPYPELIDKIASGPPLYSPFHLLDSVVNVTEMFVHHEDVRRAVEGWRPRVLDAETATALRARVPMQGKLAIGKAPARLTLKTPDGAVVLTIGSGPDVTLTADPGELLMFAFGRDEFVGDFAGDPAAVAAVRGTKRGL